MIKKILLTLLFCFICSLGWADTATYYFNAYDIDGEEWEYIPEWMVDGNVANSAYTEINGRVELLTGNTCDGTNLGTISKVELRVYMEYNINEETRLRPVFAGGDGDNHDVQVSGWSSYVDITSDTNAPSWIWSAVQSLDCDVEAIIGGVLLEVSKVEIRVTYTAVTARRIILIQ